MRKTIAMISEHASPLAHLGSVDSGGQNVYVAQVSQHLARLGYRVDVFTRCDHPSQPEIYEWMDGIRIIHVPAGPRAFVRKEELLEHMDSFTEYMIDFFTYRKTPYDLIHANFWMSGLVAANLKAALGMPFVITFHALDQVRRQFQGADDEFPIQRFEIERRVAQEADGIVAECPQDKQDLMRFYQADPAKIGEIPCGFDPQELWPVDKTLARRQIGVPENEWLVLQLGRMVPRKGVDTAIRGFAQLVRRQNIAARILIVGGESRDPDPAVTPEIGRLQTIAAEEGILDRVTFCGSRERDEIKYYYSAANVFISTPWYEPFGITPVESMACGTPVIGARVGGIQYTVVDGETGYLVAPNDPQAVGARLIELSQHLDVLKELSQNARKRVNDLFTWQKVGEMLAGFYGHILAKTSQAERTGRRISNDVSSDDSLIIQEGFDAALQTLQRSSQVLQEPISEAAKLMTNCLQRGGKLMVCGNGGSAADAQHLAAELVGRFTSTQRRGLPVLALTADSAFLTAWSNDVGYNQIFARQVEAFGRPGDLLIGISTSGRSKNIVEAFTLARQMHINCLALLGGDGGDLLSLSDAVVLVPAWSPPRVQEVHTLVLHLLCEIAEKHIQEVQQTALAIRQPAMGMLEKSALPLQVLPNK